MAKRIKKVLPPWMQGAKATNNQKMIVVHMQDGELEGLDNLQGHPSIDPETGIREYSALASIVELPEIQELFHHVMDEIETNGKISPELEKIYEFAKKKSLPYKEAPEEKHNPLAKIESTGRGGDTKLALIPLNLAFLLIEIRHVPSINPKTGLLEFGLFDKLFSGQNPFKGWNNAFTVKNILRTVGTIGGAIIGGPLGAGIGNTIGRGISGDSFGEALKGGLQTGAFAYGAQGLGQAAGLGAGTAGTGGFFGGGPNMIASGLGSVGIGSAGAAGASAAGAASASSPGIGSQIMGHLSNPWITIPAVGTLAYLGSQRKHGQDKKRVNDHNEEIEKQRKEMGFDIPLGDIKPRNRRANPAFYDNPNQEPAFFDEGPKYARGGLVKSYNQGTLVRGKGKGQDDLIKTSVPDGSYIIDASSTSAFGDGSSEAGANVLKEFEKKIKKRLPAPILMKVNREVSKAKQVPVWLSDSEYKFDPVTVAALGRGSNKKGAAILKQMVIKLRNHKISKGDGLPPKAKDPSYYIGVNYA